MVRRAVPALCVAVAAAALLSACDPAFLPDDPDNVSMDLVVGGDGVGSVQPGGSDSVASPCDGFEEQYLGDGLFVFLPTEARGLAGQTTADLGPIHAASSVDFDPGDGVVVTVGRRVTSSGVVIFVEAEDQELQRCLLDGSRYDALRDQQD